MQIILPPAEMIPDLILIRRENADMRVLLPRSISYFRFLSYTSRTDGLENQFWFRFDCGFATRVRSLFWWVLTWTGNKSVSKHNNNNFLTNNHRNRHYQTGRKKLLTRALRKSKYGFHLINVILGQFFSCYLEIE